MQKAVPQNVNLPIVHRASYAGIIRIRFEGFRGRVPFSQPGIPSSPFSIVIIVLCSGKVKIRRECFLLYAQEREAGPCLFLRSRSIADSCSYPLSLVCPR